MAWFGVGLVNREGADFGCSAPGGIVLREGESLTCYYQQHGRFPLRDGQRPVDDPASSGLPAGTASGSSRMYANACVRWQLNSWANLREPGISCEGFTRTAVGLCAESRDAHIRYRLAMPWMICGRDVARQRGGDRVDGLLVRVNASAGANLAVQTPPDGVSAEVPLVRDGGECFADLTKWVDMRRDYEVCVTLPRGQVLRGIFVETWGCMLLANLPTWWGVGEKVGLTGVLNRSREDGGSQSPVGADHEVADVARTLNPLHLLLRWRQDGQLRTYRESFGPADISRRFVPIPEAGEVQPVHMVMSVGSRCPP